MPKKPHDFDPPRRLDGEPHAVWQARESAYRQAWAEARLRANAYRARREGADIYFGEDASGLTKRDLFVAAIASNLKDPDPNRYPLDWADRVGYLACVLLGGEDAFYAETNSQCNKYFAEVNEKFHSEDPPDA